MAVAPDKIPETALHNKSVHQKATQSGNGIFLVLGSKCIHCPTDGGFFKLICDVHSDAEVARFLFLIGGRSDLEKLGKTELVTPSVCRFGRILSRVRAESAGE